MKGYITVFSPCIGHSAVLHTPSQCLWPVAELPGFNICPVKWQAQPRGLSSHSHFLQPVLIPFMNLIADISDVPRTYSLLGWRSSPCNTKSSKKGNLHEVCSWDLKFVNNFLKSLLGTSSARMYQSSPWELLSWGLRGANYLGHVFSWMQDPVFQKTLEQQSWPLSTGEDFVCVLLYSTYSALDKPILLVLKVILHFYYEAQNIGRSSCGELTFVTFSGAPLSHTL